MNSNIEKRPSAVIGARIFMRRWWSSRCFAPGGARAGPSARPIPQAARHTPCSTAHRAASQRSRPHGFESRTNVSAILKGPMKGPFNIGGDGGIRSIKVNAKHTEK